MKREEKEEIERSLFIPLVPLATLANTEMSWEIEGDCNKIWSLGLFLAVGIEPLECEIE